MVDVRQGDCLDLLRAMPDCSVHCCVTSPPYFGLRDYGKEGQIGLEETPDAYVAKMVEVFREVRRVLRDDGTLWLNLGDSYARAGGWSDNSGLDGLPRGESGRAMSNMTGGAGASQKLPHGLKSKDLIGIPWRVAFALQSDGWYLRQDIIWHKPNPMPESVRDRCTKAHEYIFLLSKADRYYFDSLAMQEPATPQGIARRDRADLRQKEGWAEAYHGNPPKGLAKGRGGKNAFRGQGHQRDSASGPANREGRDMTNIGEGETRNRRSVWTVATKPYKGAHFATFPPDLIRPCILAGCPPKGRRCDCDEVIASPTGSGPIEDPTMQTGRAGMNRPRRDDEGTRPVTRREQRHEAIEMKASPHRSEMERECGAAFAHYIRTDRSGARPLPHDIREKYMKAGWITPAPPCTHPIEDAGTVLDPFGGSGTTAQVAIEEGRSAILLELNEKYVELALSRIAAARPKPSPEMSLF